MKAFMAKYKVLLPLLVGLALASACEIEEVVDPNNPSLASVTNNATKAEIQSLVTGLEARNRDYFGNATQMFGVFGREVYAYFGSDPRFAADWLGVNITETYPDFFGSGGTYVNPYLGVKQANTLIKSANNTSALSTTEASAVSGFAKTIKAYQLLWPLNQQYQNGIRLDVEEPLNPGPILSYAESLSGIRAICDQGFTELSAGGTTLPFSLSSGFSGFNTPAGLAKVNRAIAARLALYAGDWQGALTALNASFMDLNVDAASASKMDVGPRHVYGNAPDVNNPLFYPFDQNTSTILIVHPALIENALPGDQRVVKKFGRRVNNPVRNPGIRLNGNGDQIAGEYQDIRWSSNIAPIPFIRNEELILIYAEAQARLTNPTEAVRAINIVRNTWGVGDYTGATDTESLVNEILFQRRYSLWAEAGHRWVDLRRTNRLNGTFVDLREGGKLFTQVARRTSETNWDNQ